MKLCFSQSLILNRLKRGQQIPLGHLKSEQIYILLRFNNILFVNKPMSVSAAYLSTTPTAPYFIAAKPQPSKHIPHNQYFGNYDRKRSASLAQMYSAIAKQGENRGQQIYTLHIPKDKILPTKYARRNQSFDSSIGHRIQKTIDSVNQYSQHLKSALIKQYKSQKMQIIQSRRTQKDEDLSGAISPTEIQALNSVIQSERKNEQTSKILRNDNPKMAFKTLHLLYQTIIDESLANRRKEAWEVQAMRLPMVDRFRDRTEMLKFERQLRAKSKLDRAESYLQSLPAPKEQKLRHTQTPILHLTIHPVKQHAKPVNKRLSRKESNEINPWLTAEDNEFD